MSTIKKYKVGDYVKKNSETWIPNEFDSWGRGIGVGQIVEPPFQTEENEVDVRWPGGRCFEFTDQLLPSGKPVSNNDSGNS